MKIVLIVLIAIIIWQTITLIIANVDNKAGFIVGSLIPYGILWVIFAIIEEIYLLWCRKNLCCYCLCYNNNGKITKSTCFYTTKKFIKELNRDNTAEYYIEECKSCKNIKSIPFKSDIYRGEDIFRGDKIDLFRIK